MSRKIRNIINTAVPGAWRRGSDGISILDEFFVLIGSARCWPEAAFMETFDPEHVSLMEAVCEAEDNGTDEELTAAGAALQAYRKERGLCD